MSVRARAAHRLSLRFELVLPRSAWLSLVASLACASAPPLERPPLKPTGIAADIDYLASRALAGRGAGSPGNDTAAVFLARRHQALGLPGAFPGVCPTGVACGVSYFQYFKGDEVGGHNVGSFIRGSDPDLYREFVVVGAHYDHIGTSARFALDPDLVSTVRPGADDNASGTAALLELARRLAASPPPRSVLLIHFDAEEWGLVGSRAFVQQPPVPASSMVFMLNLDMVGRLQGRDLLIDGTAADPLTRSLGDSVANAMGVPSARSNVSAGRSDHAVFAVIDVPALSLTSGFHPDYHRVSDVPTRIDIPGLTRIVDVAEGIVRAAATRTWPPRHTSSTTTPPSSLATR
ncbi:MAG TPA: M28 family peptidase [Gemmatimonadaceae bacterium]|nr:M28 family peptidase [Gemmatimonadaceae bacterium]